MTSIKDIVQSADWKEEKHVPVITAAAQVSKGEVFNVSVVVGKEIAHPNTTAHHIAWVALYFCPAGEKFSYSIGRYDCDAHGASTQGADTSTIYSVPSITVSMKTEKPGVLLAVSYCNIHGLWESRADVAVA